MPETFFVTTPIYYVNDVPHIGHAYTTVAADVLARYHRMAGKTVLFITGTDEHGQKVQEAARKRGIPPQQHCDEMVLRYRELWSALSISHDDFVRTTEERHKRVVQAILTSLYQKGDIYKTSYEGWYCVPDERFWTEKDLANRRCPECGREVQQIRESNYFFRMGSYREWLITYIDEHPDFILPRTRRNEIIGFLRQPLTDLCISRPSQRLAWGIPIPFDPAYVTYVWFDALINYVSTAGYLVRDDQFLSLWSNAVHLIGKDILTTHCVYWPTMLKALGLNPPRTIFAHGWWTVEGQKMSKSLNNVVEPNSLIARYGSDPVRFFLLREGTFGLDADFSHRAFIHRVNSELANDLGNLFNRTLAMTAKYFSGIIPSPSGTEEVDRRLCATALDAVQQVDTAMAEIALHKSLDAIWELVGMTNKYIDETAPWSLAKRAGAEERLGTVIYHVLESLRFIAVLLLPFIPSAAERMREALGIKDPTGHVDLASLRQWGGTIPGTTLTSIPQLFPRIEV
jgi:methionyl-tRNA synthetase